MAQDELECPNSASDLYLASSRDEVEVTRPVMTGDVFPEVAIPGVDVDGLAIVLTHPCSMRLDGVNLVPRLFMASVVPSPDISLEKWKTGHFRVMPLPGLLGKHHEARFEDMGLVSSASLNESKRMACLTPYGVNLLQQRFIWHLTRFLVPTHSLGESTEAVFEEADLQEEWVAVAADRGEDAIQAAQNFHDRIRSDDDSGIVRQKQLQDPQRRAGLRRQMRDHLRG